jgi:signal transduction histidine kinase/DNA-binding response OmpR family regulator
MGNEPQASTSIPGDPTARQVRQRRPSIQRSLLAASLFAASVALLLSAVAAQVFVYEPVQRSLAAAELRVATQAVDADFATLFQRVETISRLRGDWGQAGLVTADDAQVLFRLMAPVLLNEPDVSSVAIAESSGREMLLRKSDDGSYILRLTDPVFLRGVEVDTRWTRDGEAGAGARTSSDYDARRRPWFKLAMEAANRGRVVWTDPFVFRSTGMPGMSAVVRWTGPAGRDFVSTTDVTLLDLSRFTRRHPVSAHGKSAVLTSDGRVIALPDEPRFRTDEGVRANVFKPVAEICAADLLSAYSRRRASDNRSALVHFKSGGQPWVASWRAIDIGAPSGLWVVSYAPESDFGVSTATQVTILLAILLAGLAIITFLATRTAAAFAAPLRQLAAESERIGRLELERPVRVQSKWLEVDVTARSQEAMRRRLLQATSGLEAAVERRTAELAASRDAANAGAPAKESFLANMSHEIRTPMNAIVGLTQLLQQTSVDPTQRDYLGKIEDAATLLLHIVNDILDFSKIDAGKLGIERTEYLLDDVLRRVSQIVAPEADAKRLELVVHRAHDVPNLLLGDPVRLGQVLINLATNAVKFTPAGEVVLTVAPAGRPGREALRFEVRDTGIGMSADQLAKLFQPFEQADQTMTRRFGGTGLGLAISKRLVELMGDTLQVESTPMKGTRFVFDLPLQRPPATSTRELAMGHALEGMRALVADDNASARAALLEMLASLKIECDGFAGGADAVAAFEQAGRGDRPYALVFVDWRLGGEDGFEVIARMRTVAACGESAFIMVATTLAAELSQRVEAERLAGVVLKPATPSSLLNSILLGIGGQGVLDRASPSEAHDRFAQGRRVLLVEDNEVNRLIATELLRPSGAVVTAVGDAEQAIALVERGEAFDIVFMDVQMKTMDGLEATRIMRGQPAGAKMVIVALTAHAMPGDRARCIAAGMDDYLSKPVSSAALLDCLRRWL